MTNYTHIEITQNKHVATVTIKRPEARNALNAQTIRELTAAFTAIAGDPTVRCVLLRGSGTEAFCAGADLQELQNSPAPDDRRDFFTSIASLITTIKQCPTPTVSLVYGFALAGGLGLVAASDIVIAADDAQFGLPEVAVGLAPLVVTHPLSQTVAARGLSYLALSGERINAAEALRLGLVTHVVPRDSALAEAEALCVTIAQRGPEAVRATKSALREVYDDAQPTPIYELADRSALVSLSDEANEGIRAFKQKSTPSWKGK